MPPVHPGGGPALVSVPTLYELVQDQRLTQRLQNLNNIRTTNINILVITSHFSVIPQAQIGSIIAISGGDNIHFVIIFLLSQQILVVFTQ